MTRIDTTPWTDRPVDTGRRVLRTERAAEAVILAAGIVFGGLLVSAHDAYAADPQNLQTVPADTGGLDLSMPETSIASSHASTAAYDRNDGARVTDLDDRRGPSGR